MSFYSSVDKAESSPFRTRFHSKKKIRKGLPAAKTPARDDFRPALVRLRRYRIDDPKHHLITHQKVEFTPRRMTPHG